MIIIWWAALHLGRHVGEAEHHRLVLGDRLAEGLALLGVVYGELERAQRDTAAAGGHVHPADLDPVRHLVEAAARRAAQHLPLKASSVVSTPL
jgi:hypothetical protein